jgi:hypothetical protein
MTTVWQFECNWLTIVSKRALAIILVVGVYGSVAQTPARAAVSSALSAAVKANAEAGIKETMAAYMRP